MNSFNIEEIDRRIAALASERPLPTRTPDEIRARQHQMNQMHELRYLRSEIHSIKNQLHQVKTEVNESLKQIEASNQQIRELILATTNQLTQLIIKQEASPQSPDPY
jgi:methyl-accepting chemotaxis protein